MRKLKLHIQLSMDGFIADLEGKTDWMIWNWGPDWTWDEALQKYFIELKSNVDCVLLSRKMAEEGFVDHWSRIASEKENPQAGFAEKITQAHKIVFSKTIKKSGWPNTEIAQDNYIEEIKDLKKKPGNDIIVYGGASFVSSLIRAQLIDEFYFFVNPTILGKGKAIFKEVINKQTYKADEVKKFECGMLVLKYSKKV